MKTKDLVHPTQPIGRDDAGTERFKQNGIVRNLLDTGKADLNQLAMMSFKPDDWAQFYQLMGYSISGFAELSIVSDNAFDRAMQEGRGAVVKQAPPFKQPCPKCGTPGKNVVIQYATDEINHRCGRCDYTWTGPTL